MKSFFSKLLIAFCCLPSLVYAQVSRGTLSGRITDASGAVVADTQIVAVESSTGTRYTSSANKDGLYTIPFLNPGKYIITATHNGFKTFRRENVIVDANEHVDTDLTLQNGEQSETVTVTTTSSLMETVSASVGQTMSQEDVQHTPVNGNTPMVLAQLSQGVVFTGNPQFFRPFDNSGPSAMAIGGATSGKNEILMDGGPDAGTDGLVAYNAPMDGVQQVKVEVFQSDAAYGHTAGGTINMVTKSGTNKYHGTLYEYGQWSALNDTPWFTKAANQKKSVTRFNQYGGSLGGPVFVPKLFNGHDRAFFFLAMEGIQQNAPSPTIATVPTVAERNGDFSALLALGSQYTIYDPSTAVLVNGKIQRTAFANNKLTTLNPVGKNLVSFFPDPNLPGLADGTNNYYSPGNSIDKFDSEFGRIDVNISNSNKLFFDFRHNDRFHQQGNLFNNAATGTLQIAPVWGSVVDDVQVLSASTVLENRFNWTRTDSPRPLQAAPSLTSLGFPSSLQSVISRPGFPVITGTKYVDFGSNGGQYIAFDSFQYFSMLNHVVGKHSMEVGGDLRLLKQEQLFFGNPNGTYAFGLNSGQGWTNGTFSNSAAAPIGQELASLLLGLPTSGSIDSNVNLTTSAKYLAFFFQDNYTVTPKLTLNLGLRFEHDTPTVESTNRAVNSFNTTATNPINAQAQSAFAANPASGVTFPTVVGGLTFADSSHRSLYQTRALNVSPRFGFAYTPVSNISIRGGIGIFNDTVGRQNAVAPGYNQTTQMQVTLNSYLTPSTTLSNPFPSGLTAPAGNTQGMSTFLGQAVSAFPSKIDNGSATRYTLDVQTNLPGNMLFEIGYLGAHVTHLPVSKSLDYVPASFLNVGQARNAAVITQLQTAVPNPFAGLLPGSSLNGSTVQRQQLLLPYPQFTGVTLTNASIGSSFYHALQARLEKRLSHGFRVMANYQWSKKLDRLSYLNPQDVRLEKRISADDRPQHLVVASTFQLPFGHDRAINPRIPVVNYIISGWDMTEIYTFQPYGAPLAFGDVIYLGTNLNSLKVNPHVVSGAFDTKQFDLVSANQPVTGTHIRTLPSQVANARVDGTNSFDLSIAKSNRITDTVRLQFRVDFFNALNHPQFGAPNLTPTSTAFSKITTQANLPRQTQVELKLFY